MIAAAKTLTFDHVIALADLGLPWLVFVLTRIRKSLKRIEAAISDVDRLKVSEHRQWGVLARHTREITALEKRAS